MTEERTFTLTGLMAEKYPQHKAVTVTIDKEQQYEYCITCTHYTTHKYTCWPLHGISPAGIISCSHHSPYRTSQDGRLPELYVDREGNRCAKVTIAIDIEELKAQYRFLCVTAMAQMEDKSYAGLMPALEGLLNFYESIMEQIDPEGKDLAISPDGNTD